MNNKAKTKRKIAFNFIDVLLILVILVSALLLFYYLKNRRVVLSDNPDTVSVVYTLRISPMREDFRNLVQVGDPVTDLRSSGKIGEVTNVSYSEYQYVGTDKTTGEAVVSDCPGQITMVLTVLAEAEVTSTGFSVNGRELTLSGKIPFRVPDFTATAVCVSVARQESSDSGA